MSTRFPVPTSKPEYRSSPVKFEAERLSLRTCLDVVSTSAAAVLATWYSILLLFNNVDSTLGFWTILFFWAVLTYIALPRLHQLLTRVYVPGYFIGRTRTGDGLLGDPVNLALDGEEVDIHAAMRRAGWTQADEITLASSWGIVKSFLMRTSYPEAPVSDLFLFNRRQSFAYQQEVDGNAAQRHHVRFWPVPTGWLLPGGHRVKWLAAGTYDRSVGLSLFTGQLTHKIDANIDHERDYIIDTVRYADPECGVRVIKDFSTSYHSVNGGGDKVRTDGDLPVLDVNGAAKRSGEEVLPAPTRSRNSGELHQRALAPGSLWVAMSLGVVQAALIATTWLTLGLVGESALAEEGLSLGLLSWYSAVAAADVTLAIAALRGHEWGLTGMRLLYATAAAINLGQATVEGPPSAATVALVGISVFVLLAISGQRAQNWVDQR